MKSQIGGLGLLGYALTKGIWKPKHLNVTCARPGVAAAESVGDLDDGAVNDGWPYWLWGSENACKAVVVC